MGDTLPLAGHKSGIAVQISMHWVTHVSPQAEVYEAADLSPLAFPNHCYREWEIFGHKPRADKTQPWWKRDVFAAFLLGANFFGKEESRSL